MSLGCLVSFPSSLPLFSVHVRCARSPSFSPSLVSPPRSAEAAAAAAAAPLNVLTCCIPSTPTTTPPASPAPHAPHRGGQLARDREDTDSSDRARTTQTPAGEETRRDCALQAARASPLDTDADPQERLAGRGHDGAPPASPRLLLRVQLFSLAHALLPVVRVSFPPRVASPLTLPRLVAAMADVEEQRQAEEAERAIEQWKVKKLINTLEQARGYDTRTEAESRVQL